MKGTPFHLDYLVDATACNDKPTTDTTTATVFKSQVVIQKAIHGPKPMLQKPVVVSDKKLESQSSILVKYWYIFVPLFLFFLFAAPEDEKK